MFNKYKVEEKSAVPMPNIPMSTLGYSAYIVMQI